MLIHKIDYKGKWFVFQDEVFDDNFDYSIGQIESDNLTDSQLLEHIDSCGYYGIPTYIGKDELLIKRLKKLTHEFYNKRLRKEDKI